MPHPPSSFIAIETQDAASTLKYLHDFRNQFNDAAESRSKIAAKTVTFTGEGRYPILHASDTATKLGPCLRRGG